MLLVKSLNKTLFLLVTLILMLTPLPIATATSPVPPSPSPVTISVEAVNEIINSMIPKGTLTPNQAKVFLQILFMPNASLPSASYQRALAPLVKEKYLTQTQANLIAKALSYDQTATFAKIYSKLPVSVQSKVKSTLDTLIYPKLSDKLTSTLATLTKNKTLTTVQANQIYTLLRPYLLNSNLAPKTPTIPTPNTPISGYAKLIKLQQTGVINTELLNKISKGLPDALSVAYQLRVKNTLLPLVVNKTLTISQIELFLAGKKPQLSELETNAISKALASAPKFDSLTAEKQYFSTLRINGLITLAQFDALLSTLPLTS